MRPGDTILNLGTNIGMTAIIIAKMFPFVHIIGVKPMRYIFAAAQRNVKEMESKIV